MANLPESKLEAQRLVADTLDMKPSGEMLYAITLLADKDTVDEIRSGQGRRIVLLRLLVDLEIHSLTQHAELDLEALERATGTIPDLIHRAKEFDKEFRLGRRHPGPARSGASGKAEEGAHAGSRPPAGVRRSRAPGGPPGPGSAGRTHRQPCAFLSEEDVQRYSATRCPAPSSCLPTASALTPPLCAGPSRKISEAWDCIRPQPRMQRRRTSDDCRGSCRPAGSGRRICASPSWSILKLDVNAYHALMKRMQAQQDAARSEGADEVVQETAAAQRALFTTYLELTATVRNPAGKAATEDDEAAAAARDRLLREIQEVEDAGMAPSEQVKEEVLLEALTAMRDRRNEAGEGDAPCRRPPEETREAAPLRPRRPHRHPGGGGGGGERRLYDGGRTRPPIPSRCRPANSPRPCR